MCGIVAPAISSLLMLFDSEAQQVMEHEDGVVSAVI